MPGRDGTGPLGIGPCGTCKKKAGKTPADEEKARKKAGKKKT